MSSAGYFADLEFIWCALDAPLGRAHDQVWPGLFSVQFLHAGRMYFGRDGGTRTLLEAPSLFWIEPRHTYQLAPVDASERRHAVNFRGRRGERMVREGFDRLAAQGWVPIEAAGRLDGLFRLLLSKTMAPGAQAHAEAVVAVEQLLAMLQGPGEIGEVAQPHRAGIERLAARIHANPFAVAHFADEAAALHLSYSHFRRLFHRYVHRAPHAYLLQRRMLAAAEQLRISAKTVKEVAALAGFDDPAQFSRTFRGQVGLSPRAFRDALPPR
ncbi:MAG: helix-turn-helix transcriptional regulator [Kiritimatiellae bacterium]|nr:helix-turn-helix transcriptional regulator [Kiritimatiellia bacterium]